MTDWTKALNPTAPITTEDEALAAARASAIAIFIGVVYGLITIAILMTSGQAAMKAAMADAVAQNPEAAGMAGIMSQVTLWTAVAMVVIQAILGLVQWKKPNLFIPILFIALIAFGLVSALASMAMAGSMPQAAVTPIWQIILGLAVFLVELVLHVAGIRGVRKLNRMQFDAARY